MCSGQAPRTALCTSSAKVYVGVKQEIAEMRIPALNAYMKVTVGPCRLGTWEGTWEGIREGIWKGTWEGIREGTWKGTWEGIWEGTWEGIWEGTW